MRALEQVETGMLPGAARIIPGNSGAELWGCLQTGADAV